MMFQPPARGVSALLLVAVTLLGVGFFRALPAEATSGEESGSVDAVFLDRDGEPRPGWTSFEFVALPQFWRSKDGSGSRVVTYFVRIKETDGDGNGKLCGSREFAANSNDPFTGNLSRGTKDKDGNRVPAMQCDFRVAPRAGKTWGTVNDPADLETDLKVTVYEPR